MKTKDQMVDHFHNKSFPSSDIDIYLYGLDESQFREKVCKLHKHLKEKSKDVFVVKSPLTLTFVSQYPSRHIQIVTGIWKSMEQILLEPDIDCTCAGFDGEKVRM